MDKLENALKSKHKEPTTEEIDEFHKLGAEALMQNNTEEISQERARAEITKELMKKDNLARVTHLESKEIGYLSAVIAINSITKSKVVDKFTDEFKENKISLNRLGRREVVELVKPTPEDSAMGEKPWWKFWA